LFIEVLCKHAQDHELGKRRACTDRRKRRARLRLGESETSREENRESSSEGVNTEPIEEACRVRAPRVFVGERCANILNPFCGGKRVNRFRTGVGFGQEEQEHKGIHDTEYAADKKWQGWIAKSTGEDTGEKRSDNEAEAERRTDETEILRPMLRLGDIGDGRLSNSDIPCRDARERARRKEEWNRGYSYTEAEDEL
jgi:hypothetical protein